MKLFKRQEGQGLVEYALLLVLIAVVVIAVLMLLGPRIRTTFGKVIGALGGAGDFQYSIVGSPSLTKSPQSPTTCRLTLSGMTVNVTDLGEPVDNLTVAVTVDVPGAGSYEVSKETTQNGNANFNGKSFAVGKPCGSIGGSAGVSVAGGVVTTSASIN